MVLRFSCNRMALMLACSLPMMAHAMDLQQAYEAAQMHDARIRASRYQADATRERLPQAKSQRLPNVSLNATRYRNDLTAKTQNFLGQPITQSNDYYSSNQSLTIRQALYRPAVTAAIEQAREQVKDAEATLETDEQTLVQRVSQAYFEALLAQEQVELVQSQKASNAAQLDAARKALAAGSGTRTDIDEAQARVDMTVAQELEARQNQEFTRRNLESLTGQPVTSLSGLDVSRFVPEQPQPMSLQSWVDDAMANSPQVRALLAQVEAARLEIDKAQAGHKPTLDLIAQWSKTNSDSVTSVNSRYDQRSVGLQLTVPLYEGGYTSSTVRQAGANYARAQEVLEATRLELQMQVHKEFRGMTEGVLRIAALEQAVRSADQAVLSSDKSFAAGSRTTLDVLNAQQQRTVALRDLAQARYQYLLAWVQLHALAGRDRLTSIGKVNVWLAPR